MEIAENVILAPFTTFSIGGPARWFAEASSEQDLVEAVRWTRERTVPLFVLGGGSNLLVSDAGFPGLVLRVQLRGVTETKESPESPDGLKSQIFQVAAGENWDDFVERTVRADCAGIECLAGIPGTVGGTPVQNVGAYGQEVSETILRVRVLDLETLMFRELPASECGFSYRTSMFNSTERGRYLVTRVDYQLHRNGKPNLRYADLRKAFESQPEHSLTLTEVAAEVRRIRRSKGMLLVPGDEDCQSAGSFFKNPVLSANEFETLRLRLGVTPPNYPSSDSSVKLPAAWLVEHAGFSKGYVLGRAGISSRHTLALINRGELNRGESSSHGGMQGATAAEILALRDVIVSGVETKFGISLHMEPVLVGF